MNYTLKPAADGFLIINPGAYKPGDTIYLSGKFKAVAVYKLVGSAELPIKITNAPGETLVIGDELWGGGAWSHGLAMRGCRFIEVCGESKDKFIITGPNLTINATARAAYWNFYIGELSDNFKVHDLTIRYGGTGILCKTDVSKTDENTWFPNTYLENFEFYNLLIQDTKNEGIYIGHTATYWNIKDGVPVYSGAINPDIMKQPIKLRNVRIFNNKLTNIGNDGIQTAAVDGLKVYDNEVKNWATNKDGGHNGGILIGGRVVVFDVYNNVVTNGWGEFLQIYADAGNGNVKNNVFVGNILSGIGLRGGKGLAVDFSNNTIVYSGEHAFRINGASAGDKNGAHLLKKNIIIQEKGQYIYLENGGIVGIDDNKKYKTIADAKIDISTYLPMAGSALIGYGYGNGAVVEPPKPEPPAPAPISKITITSNELAAFLKALKAGSYELNFEFDTIKKKITLTVQ